MSRIEVEAEALAIGLAAVAGLYYLYQSRPTFDNLANITNKATGALSDAVDWATSGHVLADTGEALGEASDWLGGEFSEASEWATNEVTAAYATASGAIGSAIDSAEETVMSAEQSVATEIQQDWGVVESTVEGWWDDWVNPKPPSTKKPKGQGKNAGRR